MKNGGPPADGMSIEDGTPTADASDALPAPLSQGPHDPDHDLDPEHDAEHEQDPDKGGRAGAERDAHPPAKRYRLTNEMKELIWQLVCLSNECCRIENEKKYVLAHRGCGWG